MWRPLPGDKGEARRLIRAGRRARRDSTTQAQRYAAAVALADHLVPPPPLVEPAPPPAVVVAAYVSLPTEPPTEVLLERLAAEGYDVIVPVLLDDLDLDWQRVDAEGELLGREAISQAAAIVIPALSVDRNGQRLGQGGGSYDRALARRSEQAWVVAAVYDDELSEAVPHEPHDQTVDAVVTPGHGVIGLPQQGQR